MSSNLSTVSSFLMISAANCFSLIAIRQKEQASPSSIGTGLTWPAAHAIRKKSDNVIALRSTCIFKVYLLKGSIFVCDLLPQFLDRENCGKLSIDENSNAIREHLDIR